MTGTYNCRIYNVRSYYYEHIICNTNTTLFNMNALLKLNRWDTIGKYKTSLLKLVLKWWNS